jgi:thiol-disulfide isomerase/thioredoxin
VRGAVVLVNFWATWCIPCRDEMPLLEQAYRRAGPGLLMVLGVNFDEPEALVRSYAEEMRLTFPILLDPGASVQRLYRVRGYPSTFLVGADGLLRVEHIGVLSESSLTAYLQEAGLPR